MGLRKITYLPVLSAWVVASIACAAAPVDDPSVGSAGGAGGSSGAQSAGKSGTTGGVGGATGGVGGATGGVGGAAGASKGGTGGSTAGTPGSGGAVAGSGGAGLGGASGGAGISGGAAGGGGSGGSAAGAGGSSAGSGGSGGTAAPPSGDPDPSAGCGKAPTGVCDQQNAPCTAEGLNYYIDMPADYDQSKAYPVVFQYHPLGGTGQGARTMYRVRPAFMDAIYVSPDGSDNGFPNSMGKDEAVTRAIMATIEANLCVDRARYFATGFSYGGSMSYTAMCNMSDKFRAVAAMAGAPISGAQCASTAPERPVAVLGIHGENDTALRITMAEPIIEAMIERNGCTNQTQPSDLLDPICATDMSALATGEYQGCMEGYPVVWCPMPGRPHEIPQWSGAAIARFFQQF
jgi:poly(3-hydroxybutyrate) depolymerase